MNSTLRRAMTGVAIAGIAGLSLTACGSAPEPGSTDAAGGESSSDVKPCIVGSAGGLGFTDQSFNQLGLEGVTAAAETFGVEPLSVESTSSADYAPNIDELIGQGCTTIVTVGFDIVDATLAAAEANPEVQFALLDGDADLPNVKPILFNTAQAAFLAGYASAAVALEKDPTNPVVATYGGQEFPTVTIFMDGYEQGVEYYNSEKGATVGFIGGTTFTGSFAPDAAALATAQGLIGQGADVILPVGGAIYQGATQAIEESGADIAYLGVDADFYNTAPETAEILLTSVLKNIATAVQEVIESSDDFSNEPYLGTLENEGVGIAPFHDYEDRVPADLQGELDEIRAGIIDGSIPVESYLG